MSQVRARVRVLCRWDTSEVVERRMAELLPGHGKERALKEALLQFFVESAQRIQLAGAAPALARTTRASGGGVSAGARHGHYALAPPPEASLAQLGMTLSERKRVLAKRSGVLLIVWGTGGRPGAKQHRSGTGRACACVM